MWCASHIQAKFMIVISIPQSSEGKRDYFDFAAILK
jgi:hypothetical protein